MVRSAKTPFVRNIGAAALLLLSGLPQLAHAYALPPREVLRSYDWAKDLKNLAQVKAISLRSIQTEPVLHGGLAFDPRSGKLSILSPDGARVREFSTRSGGAPRERAIAETEAEKLFWGPSPSPVFEWTGRQIDYRPERGGRAIWSIPLDVDLSGQEWSSETKAWVGWMVNPRQLYVLPEPYRNFHKIGWTSEGEPVRFFSCDSSRFVLVENLSNGLSRFFYFRNAEPMGYTIFDFAGGARRAEITAVRANSCYDFYVAGSFGVTRVQYARW
jgi:hypothetical protein